MPSPTEITVAQLSRLIGLPECPVIVDVCTDDDFAADPNLIPTAIRHPFSDIATLFSLSFPRENQPQTLF